MLNREHLLIAGTFLEGQDLINRKLLQDDFDKADKNNRYLPIVGNGNWSVFEEYLRTYQTFMIEIFSKIVNII